MLFIIWAYLGLLIKILLGFAHLALSLFLFVCHYNCDFPKLFECFELIFILILGNDLRLFHDHLFLLFGEFLHGDSVLLKLSKPLIIWELFMHANFFRSWFMLYWRLFPYRLNLFFILLIFILLFLILFVLRSIIELIKFVIFIKLNLELLKLWVDLFCIHFLYILFIFRMNLLNIFHDFILNIFLFICLFCWLFLLNLLIYVQ